MNELMLNALYESEGLQHHGVIGMKWGVRRYQPYGHGGYKPEHTEGRYVGKRVKAGVSAGTVGGAEKAKFGLAKEKLNKAANKTKTAAGNVANKAKEKASGAKEKVSNKFNSIDKEKLKQNAKTAAKVLAVTAAVGVTVALAANTDTGKKATREVLMRANTLADKVNTIDTGYVKDIHNTLNNEYKAFEADRAKYSDMRKELTDALRKKYTKVTSHVTDGGKSVVNEFSDWADNIKEEDRKALDALDRVIAKKEAQAAKAGQRVAAYSEEHFAAYNTKRTQAAKLKTLEVKEKLKGVAEKMKKPADEAEAYRKQLQEEGIKKYQAMMEKKISEALAQNIEEDLEFIKKYLNAA